MYFVPGTLEPPIWDYVLHKYLLPKKERIRTIFPWGLERNQKANKLLHTELGNNLFMLGDTFTTVDILIGSTLMWKIDELNRYDNLYEYVSK